VASAKENIEATVFQLASKLNECAILRSTSQSRKYDRLMRLEQRERASIEAMVKTLTGDEGADSPRPL
jgi:hypothetical protein